VRLGRLLYHREPDLMEGGAFELELLEGGRHLPDGGEIEVSPHSHE
jgi:hypothetical protein